MFAYLYILAASTLGNWLVLLTVVPIISFFIFLALNVYLGTRAYHNYEATFEDINIRLRRGWAIESNRFLLYSRIQDAIYNASFFQRMFHIGFLRPDSGGAERIISQTNQGRSPMGMMFFSCWR